MEPNTLLYSIGYLTVLLLATIGLGTISVAIWKGTGHIAREWDEVRKRKQQEEDDRALLRGDHT